MSLSLDKYVFSIIVLHLKLYFKNITTDLPVTDSIFQLFLVGILWGGTNPFLKVATNKVKKNKNGNFISEVIDHLTNWNVSKIIIYLPQSCQHLTWNL